MVLVTGCRNGFGGFEPVRNGFWTTTTTVCNPPRSLLKEARVMSLLLVSYVVVLCASRQVWVELESGFVF